MNEDIYQQVIGQYAEENANLRIAVVQLQKELQELKKKDEKDGE